MTGRQRRPRSGAQASELAPPPGQAILGDEHLCLRPHQPLAKETRNAAFLEVATPSPEEVCDLLPHPTPGPCPCVLISLPGSGGGGWCRTHFHRNLNVTYFILSPNVSMLSRSDRGHCCHHSSTLPGAHDESVFPTDCDTTL